MIWGLTTEMFTLVHVLISVAGIASGLVVAGGLLAGRSLGGWTAAFLATTAATSITGFGFPFERMGPPHVFGVISLVLLAVAIAARYPKGLAGRWRAAYVVTAMFALYLNVFVAVVQSLQKTAALNSLAPKQEEPPFAIAQGALLVLFIALTVAAVKRFRPNPSKESTT